MNLYLSTGTGYVCMHGNTHPGTVSILSFDMLDTQMNNGTVRWNVLIIFLLYDPIVSELVTSQSDPEIFLLPL